MQLNQLVSRGHCSPDAARTRSPQRQAVKKTKDTLVGSKQRIEPQHQGAISRHIKQAYDAAQG
jgi:hypothetical protein